MSKKKLLSLEDLYEFYVKENKDVKFSSKNSNTNIVVQLNEPFTFEIQEDNDSYNPDEFKVKIHTKLCHTKKNLNNSSISHDVMVKAIPSAYNMPILGYIWKDDEGLEHFAGHEMYVDKDTNKIIYIESPVGVITDNIQLKYDKEADVERLEADGYIWKDYTNAYEILQREKDLSVSIEINIDEMSFSSKSNTLTIQEFHFTGVTILEKDPNTHNEINPGMSGSNITIADFSADNNSVIDKELLEEIKKLNNNFESLINNDSKKGENLVDKFNELLKKYNVTSDQVEFDYADLSDEELENKFVEVFGSENSEVTETEEEPEVDTNADDGSSEDEEDNTDVEDSTNEDENDDTNEEFSLTLSDGVKTFSLSYNEIWKGLYTIFNSMYGNDEDWYDIVDVYDDGTAVFRNWIDNKLYRQRFDTIDEEVKLAGEREEVFARFVTEAEKVALEMLKENYEDTKEQLEKYQAAEKEEKINNLLNDVVYSEIFESEEFTELVNNHSEFSFEEVQDKADKMLLEYTKTTKIKNSTNINEESNVSFNVKETTDVKSTKKRNRYGGIFSNNK